MHVEIPPSTTPPPLPPRPQATRPLPKWAWILAILFFPMGVFVAFGASRLLSWIRSIALTVLSYLTCFTLFGRLTPPLPDLDSLQNMGPGAALQFGLTVLALIEAQLIVVAVWGYIAYRIGDKAAFWPEAGRKLWRRMGWVFMGFFVLILLLIGVVYAGTKMPALDL